MNTVTLSPFHLKNLIAATTEKFLSMSFHFPHNCKTFISRILILLKTFVQTFAELILLSHLHHIKPSWTPQLAPPPPPPFSEFMGKYTTVTHLCTLITTIHPVSISCIYISPHKQSIIVFSILSMVAAGQMCWRSSPISYTTTTPMLVHIEGSSRGSIQLQFIFQ